MPQLLWSRRLSYAILTAISGVIGLAIVQLDFAKRTLSGLSLLPLIAVFSVQESVLKTLVVCADTLTGIGLSSGVTLITTSIFQPEGNEVLAALHVFIVAFVIPLLPVETSAMRMGLAYGAFNAVLHYTDGASADFIYYSAIMTGAGCIVALVVSCLPLGASSSSLVPLLLYRVVVSLGVETDRMVHRVAQTTRMMRRGQKAAAKSSLKSMKTELDQVLDDARSSLSSFHDRVTEARRWLPANICCDPIALALRRREIEGLPKGDRGAQESGSVRRRRCCRHRRSRKEDQRCRCLNRRRGMWRGVADAAMVNETEIRRVVATKEVLDRLIRTAKVRLTVCPSISSY